MGNTEITHLEAIRLLSGIFTDDPNDMSNRLCMCCLIARNACGDAEDDFTDEQLAVYGIKLNRKPSELLEAAKEYIKADDNLTAGVQSGEWGTRPEAIQRLSLELVARRDKLRDAIKKEEEWESP